MTIIFSLLRTFGFCRSCGWLMCVAVSPKPCIFRPSPSLLVDDDVVAGCIGISISVLSMKTSVSGGLACAARSPTPRLDELPPPCACATSSVTCRAPFFRLSGPFFLDSMSIAKHFSKLLPCTPLHGLGSLRSGCPTSRLSTFCIRRTNTPRLLKLCSLYGVRPVHVNILLLSRRWLLNPWGLFLRQLLICQGHTRVPPLAVDLDNLLVLPSDLKQFQSHVLCSHYYAVFSLLPTRKACSGI